MAVPFAFANLSGNIALSKLDSNFNTPITIGNTSVQLGNTITTINNVTLANVTITSGTSNVTNVNVTSINVTNVTATLANVTTLNATSAFITTGNIATANVGNLTLLNALTVPNGGTGLVTLPVNNVLLGNGTGSIKSVAPGNAGNVLTSIGGVWVSNAAVASGGGTGTVTNVSVVSANGFSGTVANSTSNAAITLATTFLGMAWSNVTGVLSNVAVGTGLSFNNTTGVLIATGGGGGSPGGSDTQFQYNNLGSFAGAANLTTDGANVTIGSANTLRFANLTSTRYVGFRANAIVAANVTWTLPVTDGSSNQFLKTDGTGTLSWGSAATASPILESYQTISSNYTITSGSNGFSVGPVTIATGVVVTVPTGQVWLIA